MALSRKENSAEEVRFFRLRKRIFRLLEAAEEGDRSSLYYDRCMILCILLSILPLCFKGTGLFFSVTEKVTVTVFIGDYFLRWLTADLRDPKRGDRAFFRYPFTAYAVIDLLSVLSGLRILAPSFRLLRLLRLFQTVRVLKLLRYSAGFTLMGAAVRREKTALLLVFLPTGGYILLSALLLFQIEPETFDSFFDAVYWAVITLTTVGYGDLYPTSTAGKVISMISSFVGMGVVALPTGILTAGYMREWQERAKREEKEKSESE